MEWMIGDLGPDAEWYLEKAAEDAWEAKQATLEAAKVVPIRPRRCRRCHYLVTWCGCPGRERRKAA